MPKQFLSRYHIDMKRRSLKNIFVNSPMQNRIGLSIVAVNVCVAGIALLFLLRQVSNLRSVLESIPNLPQDSAELLAQALAGVVVTPFIMLIASAAVNYIAGVVLSHRFAGPTKIIIDYIDSLIAGNTSKPRKLRPNDELKDVVKKLEELSEHLKRSSN